MSLTYLLFYPMCHNDAFPLPPHPTLSNWQRNFFFQSVYSIKTNATLTNTYTYTSNLIINLTSTSTLHNFFS